MTEPMEVETRREYTTMETEISLYWEGERIGRLERLGSLEKSWNWQLTLGRTNVSYPPETPIDWSHINQLVLAHIERDEEVAKQNEAYEAALRVFKIQSPPTTQAYIKP